MPLPIFAAIGTFITSTLTEATIAGAAAGTAAALAVDASCNKSKKPSK